jgi:hypothetical protein
MHTIIYKAVEIGSVVLAYTKRYVEFGRPKIVFFGQTCFCVNRYIHWPAAEAALRTNDLEPKTYLDAFHAENMETLCQHGVLAPLLAQAAVDLVLGRERRIDCINGTWWNQTTLFMDIKHWRPVAANDPLSSC